MRFIFSILRAAFLIVACAKVSADDDFQGATHLVPFEEAILNYSQPAISNSIFDLQTSLKDTRAGLAHSERTGYLDAILGRLKILKSSQVLVFSKTSFQKDLISPSSPRALFFNDDTYIGYIPGAPIMEISATDSKLGSVFYVLDQKKEAVPKFERRDQCLECHATSRTMGVPGLTLRSFTTDRSGEVDPTSGLSVVDHRTPLEQRWGGWYVTGNVGGQPHHGNLFGEATLKKQSNKTRPEVKVTDLSAFFDVDRYPAASSDIVALMVLEHQTHMHNFITRLRDEAELKQAAYGHINYVTNIAESFLKYMLFSGEAPIKTGIKGNSSYTKDFEALGPFDTRGRSLRQFDLKTRLFKYPCSYLIYSKAFDGLPVKIRDHVYRRLYEILSGKNGATDFPELSQESKKAVLEIIRETKKGLPEYWRS